MSVTEPGALGEFVEAIAVIASLIDVTVQLRATSLATRGAMHQQLYNC